MANQNDDLLIQRHEQKDADGLEIEMENEDDYKKPVTYGNGNKQPNNKKTQMKSKNTQNREVILKDNQEKMIQKTIRPKRSTKKAVVAHGKTMRRDYDEELRVHLGLRPRGERVDYGKFFLVNSE